MENSKLLDFLRTLNAREWRSFHELVASPYFNRNQDVLRLCDWLQAQAPGFENASREAAWLHLFPRQVREDQTLNHLMSFLLKLGEQFIGLEHYYSRSIDSDMDVLQALSTRGLDKHYHFFAEKLGRQINRDEKRDGAYFFTRYRLADIERGHYERQNARRFDETLQGVVDHLDFFYLTEKLKYSCGMLNNQAIVSSPYHYFFLEEIRSFLEKNPPPAEAPGVSVYFHILQLLTKDTADVEFQALKQLLEVNAGRFSQSELATLFEYALNYCIRQIRKVREAYVDEALRIYQHGVETGILLNEKGKLSPWHFKNIIKLALRLQQYAWTEHFIREKNQLLDDDFKTDALHYNLAELYFYTRRYDESLHHLNQVEFTDVHYNLGAKVMLAKIYYETDAYDALESLLHAFNAYLRRNKILAENVRRTYQNFIVLLRQIIRATPDHFPDLQRKVAETDLLTEKNWLQAQIR